MLRLSIVIPVLGDQGPLDDTLVSVLENRPANCELLVVHNTPYNDPYELAGEVQFIQARRGADFAECLNLGLSVSRAPVVHLLACGVEVRPGWAEAALQHFRNPEVAAVAPLLLHHDDHQTVVSAGMGYRAEGTVWRIGGGRTSEEVGEDQDELCGPDALAGFYRRSAIEAVGGFSPSPVDMLTTIDLALALRRAGFRCVLEPRLSSEGQPSGRPRQGRLSARLPLRAALLAVGVGPRTFSLGGGSRRTGGGRMRHRRMAALHAPATGRPRRRSDSRGDGKASLEDMRRGR